jgi:hypothetical protein
MGMMRFHFVVFALAICSAPAMMSAATCSVRDSVPSTARVFAKTSVDRAWQEYESLAEVPQVALDGGMTAQLVQQKARVPSVTIVAPGQEFWTYTRYCFNKKGALNSLSSELRTPLGWGYRMEGTVAGSALSARRQGFFLIKDGKPIAKPNGVGKVPTDIKPTLYTTVGELPFASLLKMVATPDGKHGVRPTLASAAN